MIGAGLFTKFVQTITTALGIRIQTILEDLFVQGLCFSARDYVDETVLLGATELFILLDATTAPGNNKQVIFEPLKFTGAKAGPITVNLYANPDIVAVPTKTPLLVTNRRGTSIITPETKLDFILEADVNSRGTRFSGRLIGSSGGAGVDAEGSSESAGDIPFELDPTLKYLAVIKNENGDPAWFEWNITWCEPPTG